uniref:Uncharacterized protein n=1 Tax=Glossina morsitans morsitans TaxID=37546 RepID=A0A1B0GB65_GLOMM
MKTFQLKIIAIPYAKPSPNNDDDNDDDDDDDDDDDGDGGDDILKANNIQVQVKKGVTVFDDYCDDDNHDDDDDDDDDDVCKESEKIFPR